MGLRVQEGRNGVTHTVRHPGHSELSERGTSWVGSPGSLSWYVAGIVFIPDGYVEVNISTIKSLMSGIYPTVKRASCQALTLHTCQTNYSRLIIKKSV